MTHTVQVGSVLGGGYDWTCFDCELVTPIYGALEVAERDADGHAADPGSHPMVELRSAS